MEVKLEVVLSTGIKRKKPWPRFCWLGQEKECVFLLDDKRISEINMVSGRTKKKTPKLHPLLGSVVTMSASQNGVWLAGLLVSGELFLWNKDKNLLKTAAAVPEVAQVISAFKGNARHLSIQVSGDGMRVLLVAITGQACLWECSDVRDLTGVRDGTARGNWAQIEPLEDTALPSPQDKEASQHSIFFKTEAIGDVCLSAFVFTSGEKLTITFLKIQWLEGQAYRAGSVGYSVRWVTKTYPMSSLSPPCRPVKSRGSLVPAFSPEGQLLAVIVNQRDPRATQVLFVSTQNFVTISRGLGGCGSKKVDIPSKYIRSYWVGGVSWAPSGLFLACVLKRGSLLMLARLGGLLSLSSSGCNVDFGPAHFLPLHPLVSYRPLVSARHGEASLSSSSMSVQDSLRQRYSVTWHPRLFYLIVSDGYMVTVVRVPEWSSPALLITALLHDSVRGLEKTSQNMEKSQINARAWLESVSCLNMSSSLEELGPTVTSGPNNSEPASSPGKAPSTLPLFLQDQGTLENTRELLHRVQACFEDDSDLEGPPAGSHVEEGGRLEFASMFDTLHALSDTQDALSPPPDPEQERASVGSKRKTFILLRELGQIQASLLTAWGLGVSLGGAVEHRGHLLKCTLRCVVRLAALLHLAPASKTSTDARSRVPRLLTALLAFLSWDAGSSGSGTGCLALVVELVQRLVRLSLAPPPASYPSAQLSSHSLSTALSVLRQASHCLDRTYSLQQRTVWASTRPRSASQAPRLWPSDGFYVPLLQDETEGEPRMSQQASAVPQRPSSRLLRVWQHVYRISQQYMGELEGSRGCEGWEEEKDRVSLVLSQIQTALQGTGERLPDNDPGLLPYPGEHYFLTGSYSQSIDAWKSEIWAGRNESSDRKVFQDTRLCLALLYGLLFQYRLNEAQGFGDYMARVILHRAGPPEHDATSTAESFPGSWLPTDLCSEAAFAVVQTLGRFMASYFTNQPLYIRPPHNVNVLPSLHLPHGAPGVGRLVPLCQEKVAGAVRRQQLSDVWTVDYTQDLLLIGGLLPEAVWLAQRLGDWKTAASLGLAYTTYCSQRCDFTRLRSSELHLPKALEPSSIFQAQLEALLGSQETVEEHTTKSYAESLQGEDLEVLQVSVQEILKASVMAGVDVVSSPLSALLDSAKELSSCQPALVPSGLYLPAPPLYCPQPAPNTQDPRGTVEQLAEVASRHRVSAVLQRLLLLLRSARCCFPAAQWYVSRLRRARHLLYKIKKKYCHPSATEEELPLPEGLMKFNTRNGFFRGGPKGGDQLDPITVQTIICFRELCALCWMLHVRDQLSASCRKYQAARQHRDTQVPGDSEVRSSCMEALHWARRFLPFSHFLNAEEILQDVMLSLVSELPPVAMVAEILVQSFPEEEESVRVPLREKYTSLLQRLRPCHVLATEQENEESGETMMVLIQDKLRQRRKDLKRLRRHLAPPELYLWEREEEEDDRGGGQGMGLLGRHSLGASLSTSTLTDWGNPMVYSDGDTAENTSEAVSPQLQCRPTTSTKKVKGQVGKDAKKPAVNNNQIIQEENDGGADPDRGPEGRHSRDKPSLPVVGTWEFELEDEEYLRFLELFLSYVLEKDSAECGGDSGCEPPLLRGFCSQLRERELHSLTFDVLTTLHRRQRDGRQPPRRHGGGQTPLFRAGQCYKLTQVIAALEPRTSSARSDAHRDRTGLSSTSLPGMRTGRQQGLFGLQQQARRSSDSGVRGGYLGSEPSLPRSPVPCEQPSEGLVFGSLVPTESIAEPQHGLHAELEAQFPELGRLLEWMVRWADRRVLLRSHGNQQEKQEGAGGGGVVIRVKALTPAVLTALGLLEHRYAATALGSDHSRAQAQWAVAPVARAEERGRKQERDSGADTRSPSSACYLPVTPPDQNALQGEPCFGSDTEEPERQPSNETEHNDEELLTLDSENRTSTSQLHSLHEDTPEPEDKSLVCEGCSALASVSLETKSGHILPSELALKLSDLCCSKGDEEISTGITPKTAPPESTPPLLEPQPPPAVRPEAGVKDGVKPPNTPVAAACIQPPSSTTSTAGLPAASQTAPVQPEPVRQLLNDELFRLVLLQQVNFMSMMQMMGTSFANMPLFQQNTALAQANINPLQNNVPPSNVTNTPPPPNPLHTSSSTRPLEGSEPNNPPINQALTRSTICQEIVPDQPATTRNSQKEMQPLSLHAELPGSSFGESGRLIPSSQGLLSTINHIDRTEPVPSAQLMRISKDNSQNNPASQVLGLKLLQLPPQQRSTNSAPVGHLIMASSDNSQNNPASQLLRLKMHQPHPRQSSTHYTPVREAWGPLGENTSTRVSQNLMDLPRPSSLDLDPNRPCDASARSSQPQATGWTEFPIIPPSVSTAGPPPLNLQGFRLLHLPSFPQLATPPSSRPSATPIGVQLLHLEPEPKLMFPPAGPPAREARFIPLEEMASLVGRKKNAREDDLRLLRVDPSSQLTDVATPSSRYYSSKRQKRREKKMSQGERAVVTFRPNESIIPVQEPIDGPVNESADEAVESTVRQGIPTAFGSFESLLTGQRLLDSAVSTAAELHAFAATQKRPPESQDACTNTASPPALSDKAVSTQTSVPPGNPESKSSAAVLPPELIINPWFPGELSVRDTEEKQNFPEHNLDLEGRQFINVIDLEDGALLQQLPPASHICASQPASPTSAQLHLMAASALTSAAPQSTVSFRDGVKPVTQQDAPEESSPPAQEPPGDPVTVRLLQGRASASQAPRSPAPLRTSSMPPMVQFSARLSAMDAQLAALQDIADHLDMEFSSTRMLVKTIDSLAPVCDAFSLSVPQKAWGPQPYLPEPNERIEEEKEEDGDRSVHVDSSAAEQQPAFVSPQSAVTQRTAGPGIHTPSKMKDEDEELGISELLADETLNLTGLSDATDILEELVRDGALTPNDLLLFHSHSAPHLSSRVRLQQRGFTPQTRVSPDEERKRELRIWMKRKQRERLTDYQKQRAEMREREYRPYTNPVAARSAFKNQAAFQKMKEEKDMQMLLEQYNLRALEACSLINELPTTLPIYPSSTHPAQAQPTGSINNRTRTLSVSDKTKKKKAPPRQSQPRVSPSLQPVSLVDIRRRLGLDRPVTVLPRDRLSQVTRRGMVTDLRGRAKSHAANHGQEPPRERRQRMGSSKSPSGRRNVRREQKEENGEGEVVSSRSLPPVSSRLPGTEPGAEPAVVGLLEGLGDGARGNTMGADWLDNLSESGSSCLSKLDWAAIERMVATEGTIGSA